MTAPRILVGLARAVRRQIGNTGLGGCNRRPLEKKTAFKFCLFGAAPSRESSFFIKQARLLYCDQLKVQHTYFFHRNILIFNPEGSWEKTDPASSTRSNKKGLNDNDSRLLGIVNKFCIPFGTKNKIVICGGLDSASL